MSLCFGLLLIAALPVYAQSTALDSLPQASQEEISSVCLPVQFREGAGAYRNCVQAELQLRSSGGSTEMAQLSFDDKYAVQQACAKAGGQSSSAYQSCVTDQIGELNNVNTPVFDNVSEDELYAVQQTCFDAQSKQGAAAYRQCLNGEIKSLLAVPAADTSNLNMLNKNALQLRCSANATTATQYRQCIAVEFESIAGLAPTFLPVSSATQVVRKTEVTSRPSAVNETVTKLAVQERVQSAPAAALKSEPISQPESDTATVVDNATTATMALPRNVNPQRADSSTSVEQPIVQTSSAAPNTTSTLRDATGNEQIASNAPTTNAPTASAETRVISRPDLVKALDEQARAEAQGIELEKPAPTDVTTTTPEPANTTTPFSDRLNGLWQKFLDALASLNGIGWLILAGVLALPALVLGLFSLTSRMRKPAISETNNSPLSERIEPGMRTRKLQHEREAADFFDEFDEPAAEPTQSVHREPEQNIYADDDAEHDAVTRIAMKDEQLKTSVSSSERRAADAHEEKFDAAASNYVWQSAFGHWLTKQPDAEKMELCIEFLIYWVAYGDDRYDPELKKQVFTATELNPHDQIKRSVLKQDVFAFSDVVGWLRSHCSPEQLEQSISLVMALLVTENSVTPVQNTLLRFLSDAFNMGKSKLEQQFETAFGHPLPDMPRPDKVIWWEKQEAESVQRWNSRALAARPDIEQMMARLGVSDGFNDTQVINAFRRASRRCHPDRFTHLGARERALAEQRFAKFEEARDKLLGVSV